MQAVKCTKTLTVQVVKDGCMFDEGNISKVLCNTPKKTKTKHTQINGHTLNKRLNQNINREVKRHTGEVLVSELDSRDHN